MAGRAQGGVRVITFGTFDLFHIGHLRILERARAEGSWLAVGVSSDELNFSKKGRYPIFPEDERMAIVEALRCVDAVFLEESLDLKREYIRHQRADILIMGSDWSGHFDELRDVCAVRYLARTDRVSTSEVERFIRQRAPHHRPDRT